MEAVRAFNNELSSLYESKPPVSRAKMAQITKFAIKAIKFYKHVVQSVEKFIQKCKPEYKVPGLYVIDSIVRQSRHQFGPEKDVFSPRFTKNIVTTFTHLFKCSVEERSRVVRVLNLWQKNSVFSMDIIQPLLDLAADPENTELISAAHASVDSVVSSSQKVPLPGAQPSSNGEEPNSSSNQILQQTEMLSTITKLLKQAQEVTITKSAPDTQLQQLQHLQQQLVMQTERITKPQQEQSAPPIDSNLLAQIQMLTSQLLNKPATPKPAEIITNNNQNQNNQTASVVQPLFNKKLLEFDYDDSDESDDKEDYQPSHTQEDRLLQSQLTEIPLPAMPKMGPDQNTIQKMMPEQHNLSRNVPDQNFLSKSYNDQSIFPKSTPDQSIFSISIPDQSIFPKAIPDQNIFPKTAPDQDIFPKTAPDQDIFPKTAPDQYIFPKVPDQQIFSNPPSEQNRFPFSVQNQQKIFPPMTAPDQNIFPKGFPDHSIFSIALPGQNIFPKPPDQDRFSKLPDQNIFPNLPDQNRFPNLPDQERFPDQDRFSKLPEQNIFSGVPNHDIFSKIPDQNLLPKSVPEHNAPNQIQQISHHQGHHNSEFGNQGQLHRHLEQQQQQFDREIELESFASHRSNHGFNQDQDRRSNNDRDDRENHDNSSHRRQREKESRDMSRSPRRRSRRSRSRSRDRDRDRRRRSRSRDRYRRSRSRDRERREKERERKKVGLPPLRSNRIAICSTTIWFGRLTKHTTEEELKDYIEKYGKIRTINMIPPRGCAFVCVTKRRDASKVMDRMKGIKINGNTIKVAWAPGIGVKESEFKDLWDVDLGVTYIPWEKLPKDVVPLLAGGMVDEDSLPERLKGMKTGEEDEVEEQQETINKDEAPQEDNTRSQQPPLSQVPTSVQGPPKFPMPGQNPIQMGPGGPLSLLSGPPPPIGIAPGIGAPFGLGGPNVVGGPNAMLGPNNVRLPNNMGNIINPMPGFLGPPPGVRPGLPGQMPGLPGAMPNMRGGPGLPPGHVQNLPGAGPNMQGMGPRQMNFGPPPPQGSLMRGQFIGGPPMATNSSPAGVNSSGPRGPFGQFGNTPRFPPMQGPGGLQPFVDNGSHQPEPSMGDSDMRAMAEPKEWPPDDEVNAEDESDDDHHMDSDERVQHSNIQPPIPGSSMPNLQTIGNPFGIHGPILSGQMPPNSMLGIPRAPSPNTGMPSLISLRMMPPVQQPSVIAISGGPAPGFALAPQRVRLAVPTIGLGQGLLPVATSPHLIPPPTVAPVAVSVNGPVVVTGPGLPVSNAPINTSMGENSASSSEGSTSDTDKLPPAPGLVSVLQINQPPPGPILGRAFAPMTIRPRAASGLLNLRPGAVGGAGINRFGGARPIMGPSFGEINRPPFGNRFGAVLRPPVGFLDQDEREDRDERKPLPRIDDDPAPAVENMRDQSVPKDIDERNASSERKAKSQDIDMRQDIDERSKSSHSSDRPNDNLPGNNNAESGLPTAPSVIERLPATNAVQSVVKQGESVPTNADVSASTSTTSVLDEGEVIKSS